MSEVKWIKITTDIFDDEKILLIESLPDAYAIIVVWFKLLCLAGKMNNSGVFVMNNQIAYTDKMLATIFRMKESTVQLALQTFEQFGMVEIIDGVITIPNWGKHQNLEQLEERKRYQREYQREYRKKQKLLVGDDKGSCKCLCNDDVNALDKEEDKEKDKDKDTDTKSEKRKAFSPPTVDEVRQYCRERGNGVDAERFVDYYSSNGWMVGKNKMKNWQAAVRTWEKRDSGKTQTSAPVRGQGDDLERLTRILGMNKGE